MATSNDNGRGGYPTKSSLAAAREEVQALQPAPEQHGRQMPQAQPPQQLQQHGTEQPQPPKPSLQRPTHSQSPNQQDQLGSPSGSAQQGSAPKAGQHQQQQLPHAGQQRLSAGQQARPARPAQPPPPPQQQQQPRQQRPVQPRPLGAPVQRPPGARPPLQQQQQAGRQRQASSTLQALRQPLPLALLSTGSLAVSALLAWGVASLIRRGRSRKAAGSKAAPSSAAPGPCAKVKPTQKCVPLADGSACVIRREIPADNSCLFNAIGYVMHGSKTKASFLRGVVAREVSSDPAEYNEAFLGMSNMAYCNWIMQPMNWGGGIELAILSRHYGREIAAWNIESKKPSIFGEEQGYPRHVMIIYTGSHYDALAIAKHPKAPESEDKVEFNPRTKTGKMAIAAAQKLTELAHRSSKFYRPPVGLKLKCRSCKTVCKGPGEVEAHAKKTGHQKFDQIK